MKNFCLDMAEAVKHQPMSYLPVLEEAVKEVYAKLYPTKAENAPTFQLQISSEELPQPLRTLKSSHLGTLINVSGIIINSGKTMLRGKSVTLQCRGCEHKITRILSTGVEGVQLPFFCERRKDQGAYVLLTD